MKEIIFVHVGQCGVQVGNQLWELFCLEHQLTADGRPKQNSQSPNNPNLTSIFSESPNSTYTPRCLHIDTEPTPIDSISHTAYKNLFNPHNKITGKQDSANNYIRGHYTIGKYLMDEVEDRLRREVEKCQVFQGFFWVHSVNGGTGSGLTALMMERVSVDFGKKAKVNVMVYPSETYSDTVVQPYNAVLAGHSLVQYSDLTIPFTNQTLSKLSQSNLQIDQPSFPNLNHLISQTISSLTLSNRYPLPLSTYQPLTLRDTFVNLVPYPRIHFITSSFNQFKRVGYGALRGDVERVMREVFQFGNFGVDLRGDNKRFMAACVMYRGDVAYSDAVMSANTLRQSQDIKFVEWVPTGLKLSTNSHRAHLLSPTGYHNPPIFANMLSNNLRIDTVFGRVNHKFDKLYARRAFVHWYVGEGLDQGFFGEAREDMAALEKDYEDGSDYDPHWFDDVEDQYYNGMPE